MSFGNTTITGTQFSLVNAAAIIQNNHPLGPGSSDRGDNTVRDPLDIEGPVKEQPTAADVVASLGNTNLNSIIDTADNLGTSIFDVYFKTPTDTFFFWERGLNSDLTVQALDTFGNLLGDTFEITRDLWKNAGYSINTTEIANAQKVGSWGLKSKLGNIAGLRLSSGIGDNGPDLKVVGATVPESVSESVPESVPEPATLAGLGLVAGSLVASRRRRQASKVS